MVPLPTFFLPSLTTTLPVASGPPDFWNSLVTLPLTERMAPFWSAFGALALTVAACLLRVSEPIEAGAALVHGALNGSGVPLEVGIRLNVAGIATEYVPALGSTKAA